MIISVCYNMSNTTTTKQDQIIISKTWNMDYKHVINAQIRHPLAESAYIPETHTEQ